MSFKLRINDKTDEKLLQNFPKDPYSDIRILTQQFEFDLSLAYLSIDSQYFAELASNCSEVDLSHLNEQFLVYVLRALYGGDLEASSVGDVEQIYKVVDFLKIQEYKNSIKDNLKNLHELKKETSPFNHIEMLEFSVRTGVLKDQVLNYHFESRLKVLQSSKNYLQLGKLSDQCLNTILLTFSSKQGEKGDSIINHILQNYFNRKSYRPADYFTDTQLLPLRLIWQKFHHKLAIRSSKLQKTTSIRQLKDTTPITAFQSRQLQGNRFGNLGNIPAINTQSVNLGLQFKSEKKGEQANLDLRLQTLTKELQLKNKKIESLQTELKQLMQIKAQRQQKASKLMQASIQDVTLFKNVARSRRSRQQQLRKGDNSVSSSELAYDNIKKVVQQQREGKIKIVSKTSMNRKIFN